MNGKENSFCPSPLHVKHTGVTLLPFVDESKLIAAVSPLYASMTKEEEWRNRYGDELLLVSRKHKSAALM